MTSLFYCSHGIAGGNGKVYKNVTKNNNNEMYRNFTAMNIEIWDFESTVYFGQDVSGLYSQSLLSIIVYCVYVKGGTK